MDENKNDILLEIDRDKAPLDPDLQGDIEENIDLYGDHLAELSDGLFDLDINTEIVAFPSELPSLMVTDEYFNLPKAGIKADPVLITYEKIPPIDDLSDCYLLTVSIRLLFDKRFHSVFSRHFKEWDKEMHISKIESEDESALFYQTTTEYGGLSSPGAVALMIRTLIDDVKLFIGSVKRTLGGK